MPVEESFTITNTLETLVLGTGQAEIAHVSRTLAAGVNPLVH